MRLLELFSGTKSVGRAFEALGWEVTSLDTDATTRPTICADIQEWDDRTYPPGHFDFIWASPVCTEFSRALTRRPRRLTEGDGLVLKTATSGLGGGPSRTRERACSKVGPTCKRCLTTMCPTACTAFATPNMEQPALDSQPTGLLQARPLRSLPRWPAPRNRSEARQPALARPDPKPVVLPAAPAVPGDRGEPKWER